MFELTWRDLTAEDVTIARAAVVPWDSETFGFPVGQLELTAAARRDCGEVSAYDLEQAVQEWALPNNVELIAATVAANDHAAVCLLQQAGLRYVDQTLDLCYAGAGFERATAVPAARVDEAAPTDRQALRALAASAFRHGRFHADARFPDRLADLRYADWVTRALDTASPQRVLVVRDGDDLTGFAVVEPRGAEGYEHLMAVAPQLRGGPLGPALHKAALQYLVAAGARRVRSKISAGNDAVLNLHASFGARFERPEAVLHWHIPGDYALHLDPAADEAT